VPVLSLGYEQFVALFTASLENSVVPIFNLRREFIWAVDAFRWHQQHHLAPPSHPLLSPSITACRKPSSPESDSRTRIAGTVPTKVRRMSRNLRPSAETRPRLSITPKTKAMYADHRQSDQQCDRYRGCRRYCARTRYSTDRRQHFCHALSVQADRIWRRHRLTFGDQVCRWS